jgi:hypothetical protein
MGFKKRSGLAARAERIASVAVASGRSAADASGPLDLDEVLEEPLLDASGVYRVSSQLASAQRGADEDENRRFRDPSLVIEAEKKGRRDGRRPGTENGQLEGSLFGAYLQSLPKSSSEPAED